MTDDPIAPRALGRIFHPTDLSPASEVAFLHALRLAVEVQASLHVVHVKSRIHGMGWGDFPSVRETLIRWKLISQTDPKSDLERLGVQVEKLKIHGRRPASAILHHLRDEAVGLIVLASHRRSAVLRLLRQQVACPVAFGTGVPTLFLPHGVGGFVSRTDGKVSLRRVLIPVDHEPEAQPALILADMLGRAIGAKKISFTLLHVGREEGVPELDPPKHRGWKWEVRVRRGDVVKQILVAAEELRTDLIVLSSYGRHGLLDALRGSTTERLLARAACPVLAVPAV